MKITAFILAFYLLIGSLIPRMDFSQLMYLGDLKEHYLEHQEAAVEQQTSFTFLEFLYNHFIDSQQHSDVDHEEDHHKLPLQSFNGYVDFLLSSSSLPEFVINKSTFLLIIAYQCPFYLSGFQTNMVQPPSFS